MLASNPPNGIRTAYGRVRTGVCDTPLINPSPSVGGLRTLGSASAHPTGGSAEAITTSTMAPSPIHLRPYQRDALAAVEARFNAGDRSTLLNIATGGGKTVIFAELARRTSGRTLVLAHRAELIQQAAAKIEAVTGQAPGIEMGGVRANASDRIVVGSVQTLVRINREIIGETFELVVIDECHRAAAASYRAIIDKYQPDKLLGVTATPFRADDRELGAVFESLAYTASMIDLMVQGYLVDVRVHALPVEVNLSNVRTRHGDLASDDLGEALSHVLAPVAAMIADSYASRKLLAFCPTRATSVALVASLIQRGLPAAHIDGESPDRAQILADFRSGKIRFLSNANLLTEGYDEPSIEAILLFRPTKSKGLLTQMIGRGTRLHPGKDHLIVIDPLYQTERHDLVSVPDLALADGDTARRVSKIMRDKGSGLKEAIEIEIAERQAKLADTLNGHSARAAYNRSIRDLSPYEASLAELQGFLRHDGLLRLARDHPGPAATMPQLDLLRSRGVSAAEAFSKPVATQVIGMMLGRQREGLCTLKQWRFLGRRGMANARKMTFAEASAYIGGGSAT